METIELHLSNVKRVDVSDYSIDKKERELYTVTGHGDILVHLNNEYFLPIVQGGAE